MTYDPNSPDEVERAWLNGFDAPSCPHHRAATLDVERLARARAIFHHGEPMTWDMTGHPDDCDLWADDFIEGVMPEYDRLGREGE